MDNNIFESVTFLNEEYDPHDPKSRPEKFSDFFKMYRYKTGKLNKKDQEYEKKREEQKKKELEESRRKNREQFEKEMKDKYNITNLDRISDENFNSSKEKYNAIVKDSKQWLMKILNSKEFKNDIEDLMSDEEELDYIGAFNPGMPKPSLSYYKSLFKIEEGVNGWQETIQICDGSQEECIHFNWVTYLIADLIEARYDLGCSCGDGDEGHIYYDIEN